MRGRGMWYQNVLINAKMYTEINADMLTMKIRSSNGPQTVLKRPSKDLQKTFKRPSKSPQKMLTGPQMVLKSSKVLNDIFW